MQSDQNTAQVHIQDLEDLKLQETWTSILNNWESISETEENELWNSYYAQDSDYALALTALNRHSEEIIWPLYSPIPFEDRSLSANHAQNRLEKTDALSVFPNPTSNSTFFTYDTEMKGEALISIYDSKGSLVHSVATNESGITELNTKNWAKGLYAVTLSYKGYSLAQIKLIKH